MHRWIIALGVALAGLGPLSAEAARPSVVVEALSAGPTPFISLLDLRVSPPTEVKSVDFVVASKPGSVVRPIRARYTQAYLERRGYLDLEGGLVTVPVFGLYADAVNQVSLKVRFHGGGARRLDVAIPTELFDDPSGVYVVPTVIQPRSPKLKLGYDYIMLKSILEGLAPVIIDTDGEVRWVGTADAASLPGIHYQDGIYVAKGTRLLRIELDGSYTEVADYASLGVTSFHHNFDLGKRGFLIEVDKVGAIESTVLEVDAEGQVLQTWDFAEIIRAAMIDGGDDPSDFVRDGVDWFHNNACTYQKKEDLLIASSRENFVIAVDYDTGEIRWILGDPAKQWHQYPSLTRFALTLEGDSLPPIGQHAISTKGRTLLLFDNGAKSNEQSPPGEDRDYSAARRYRIDPRKMTAREIWTYEGGVYSPFCSSVYEERRNSFLIDYAVAGLTQTDPFTTEVLGLSRGRVAFHYRYPAVLFCGTAWNSVPIHLEKLVFD